MAADVSTTPSHFYEQQKCSGTLLYIIDDCEPTYIKFSAKITLSVILDDKTVSNDSIGRGKAVECQQVIDDFNSSSNVLPLFGKRDSSFHQSKKEVLSNCGEKESGHDNDEGVAATATRNAIENPHHNVDIIPDHDVVDEVEGLDKFDSSVDVSGNIASKDTEGRPETKKSKMEPKRGLRRRLCKDVRTVKSKVVKQKRIKGRVGKNSNQEIAVICENELVTAENNLESPDDMETESKGRRKQPRPLKLVSESDRVKCDYCSVMFPNKLGFYNHRLNKGSQFECKICHKHEPFEANLLIHMQSHEPDKGYVYDIHSKKKGSNGKKKRPRRKCPICGTVCSNSGLLGHVMLHTQEGQYRCCICSDPQSFPSLTSLRHHLESHKGRGQGCRDKEPKKKIVSQSELPQQCQQAGNETEQEKAEESENGMEMVEKKLESPSATKSLKSSYVQVIRRGRHKKQKPQKTVASESVKCDYCDETFPDKLSFYNHRLNKVSSDFECNICHKHEPFEAQLIAHMLSHEPHRGRVDIDNARKTTTGKKKRSRRICPVCGKVCSNSGLLGHLMLHTKECQYRCCVCPDQTFPTRTVLRQHLEIHKLGNKGIQCRECQVSFATRSELSQHQLTHEIKCDLCGDRFPNKTSRACHYRTSHANEIRKCSECWSLFVSEEELQKHMLYHLKRKKEQCPICGVIVAKLKTHMANHEMAGEQKLYACDRCPMRYKSKYNLDKHLRIHTGERPYTCHLCPKNYRCHLMLRKHLLSHSTERLFGCEFCDKRFIYRSNLQTHMKVHAKVKPQSNNSLVSCVYCLQGFSNKTSLGVHLKTDHNITSDVERDQHQQSTLYEQNQFVVQNTPAHSVLNMDSRASVFQTVTNFVIPPSSTVNLDNNLVLS